MTQHKNRHLLASGIGGMIGGFVALLVVYPGCADIAPRGHLVRYLILGLSTLVAVSIGLISIRFLPKPKTALAAFLFAVPLLFSCITYILFAVTWVF
jgi:hypothetical protein